MTTETKTPAEIAASLTDNQRWLIGETRHGMRGIRNYFDLAGYGPGVAATARSLRRRGLVCAFGLRPEVAIVSEIRLTDLGRAVAAELTRGEANR